MNRRQLRHIVDNRRRRWSAGLFAADRVNRVLASAAQHVQRIEAARTAWERLAEPGWLQQTSVQRVEGDAVVISVDNDGLRYELSRQAGRLGKALARLAPHVRRLRFVPSGAHDTGDARGPYA